MELDACCFPLPLPRVVIGAENAVAEEVPDVVAEVGAFREVREFGLEEVLDVARIGGDDAV